MKHLTSLMGGFALALVTQITAAQLAGEEVRVQSRGQARMNARTPSRPVQVAPRQFSQASRFQQAPQVQQTPRVRSAPAIGEFRSPSQNVTRTIPRTTANAPARITSDPNRVITSRGNRVVTRGGQQFDGRTLRFQRPPGDIHRHWDRDQVHSWNHHRWHWNNGAWVILDTIPGYSYDYYDYGYEPGLSTYSYTDTGSLAVAVQQELSNEGYYSGVVDGVLGPLTRDAIAAYQRDHNLTVTGTITSGLLNELNLD